METVSDVSQGTFGEERRWRWRMDAIGIGIGIWNNWTDGGYRL
jgi:hypothetical protein